MGIFSKSQPIDSRFALPAVKPRECIELRFPCKSEVAWASGEWLIRQVALGFHEATLLHIRIMETSEYWEQLEGINLNNAAGALAQYVTEIESIKLNENDFLELYWAAHFGLLAGLFEMASKATSEDYCHPAIWNALLHSSALRRRERGGDEISEKDWSFKFLCDKTGEAGYVMGKLGGLSLSEVFKRWAS